MTNTIAATEFRRWRDAPIDRREQVARHQLSSHSNIGGRLFPDLSGENRLDVVLPCGKPLRDCTADDLREMADWLCDLVRASRTQADAVVLRSSVGDLRI
jgi:hypothetical protein